MWSGQVFQPDMATSRVAVHAAEDEVDPEICYDNAEEGDDAVVVKEHGFAGQVTKNQMNFASVPSLRYRCLTLFGEGRLRLGTKKRTHSFFYPLGLQYRCLTMFGEGRLRLGIKKEPILFLSSRLALPLQIN